MIFIRTNVKQIALISCITITTSLILGKIVIRYWRNRKRPPYQPIIICNDWTDWIAKEKEFMGQLFVDKFIGLDCEWVTLNNKRRPIALLQIATAGGLIVLFRLCNIQPGFIPSTLVELLADKNIIKVGVAICEDARKLLYDYGLIVESCLDLRHLIRDKPEFQDKKHLSLQSLSKIILEVELKKSMSLTCSNWEAVTLTHEQVIYAAEDALAAAQIFKKLLEPSHKKWLFSNYGLQLEKFQDFFNVPFKRLVNNDAKGTSKKIFKSYKVNNRYTQCLNNVKRYENCQLLAPDGEQLCACNAEKALWYVNKDKGEIINRNPLIVRLNFEPSGRPILDNKYYTQTRENCCVVCGHTENLVRKFVVPYEYRKHFPGLMKSSLSHDILLLCVPCHRKSNMLCAALREQLVIECGAPLGSGRDVERKTNSRVLRTKSAARALLKSQYKIPEKRQLELKQIISDYYETENVTEDLLKEASDLNGDLPNDEFSLHGYKVYEYVCRHGGLMAFESRWRQYFLDTMEPKFLPDMWSIDHNHQRLVLQVLQNKADFDVSILGINDKLMNKVKSMNL